MNNSVVISKLAQNPLIAYSITIPHPEELELTAYEESAFPAILGNLTGLSMAFVRPKFKLGRIWSFDITPRQANDPIIIYSPIGNLAPYYKAWSDIMGNRSWFSINKKIRNFDNSIRAFVETSQMSGLSIHETVFAVIEMLKFKNDVALNRPFG